MSTNAFKFSKYKTKLIGSTVAPNEILENYLSNFWQSLEMSLINCKV